MNVVQGGAGGYAAPLAATYRPLMDQGAPRTPRDAAPSPSPIEMSFEVLPGSSPDPAPRPGLLDRSRELAGRFGARRRPAPSDPGASQPSPPGDPGPPARALPSRTRPVAGAALVVVLLGVWWSFSAIAALKDSDCLECHSDKTLSKTNATGKEMSLFVDPARLAASAAARVFGRDFERRFFG